MATSLLLFAPWAIAAPPPPKPTPAPLAKRALRGSLPKTYAYATVETRASSTRKAYLADFPP